MVIISESDMQFGKYEEGHVFQLEKAVNIWRSSGKMAGVSIINEAMIRDKHFII